MERRERIVERYVVFLLRHRAVVLLLIGLATAFFGYRVSRLKIATDFVSFYPPRHPFIQTYNQYRYMFGSANVLVTAVEVKDVDLPQEMLRAIAKQAEAERERRAKVINAEGEFQAATRLAEAAEIIMKEPAALQLRYLQTLIDITGERTSLVVPVPLDLLGRFGVGGATGEPKA